VTTCPPDTGDDDARLLIERVVRHPEREAAGDITVERLLLRRADGLWDVAIDIALDGMIEHSRLPQDLGSRLAGKFRARIRPVGDLLALLSFALGLMES
jgi:hypothetical protein